MSCLLMKTCERESFLVATKVLALDSAVLSVMCMLRFPLFFLLLNRFSRVQATV